MLYIYFILFEALTKGMALQQTCIQYHGVHVISRKSNATLLK
jgi:hypothetical protein